MISKNNFTYSGGTLWKSYERYLNIHHDLVTLFTRYRNFRFCFFLLSGSTCPLLSFDLQTTFFAIKMAWSGSQFQQLSASTNVMHRKNTSAAQSPSNNFGRSNNSGKTFHDYSKTNHHQRSNGNAIKIQDVNQASSNVVRQSCFHNFIHNISAGRKSVCIFSDVYNWPNE